MVGKRVRKFFLAQVNEEADWPLYRGWYSPFGWDRSVGDETPSEARCGDLIVMYFGGKAPDYRKQIGVVFKIIGITRKGTRFKLKRFLEFEEPIRYDEIQEFVRRGTLQEVFRRCGQQGFNMTRIQRPEYESLIKISRNWHLREEFSPMPEAVDLEQTGAEAPGRRELTTYRIIRDTKLARELKLLYSNRCQICGSTIHLTEGTYSEAHHIRPLGAKYSGSDTTGNIVVLCPNHHAMFDFGAIAIDPDTTRVLHADQRDRIIGERRTVLLKHALGRENLSYHIARIFGKRTEK